VARVEDQLGRSQDLDALLDAIRDTLRLPYAALDIRTTDTSTQHTPPSATDPAPATSGSTHSATATAGVAPPVLHARPLVYADTQIGELVVGLRPGERRLRAQDGRVLELLATPLAVAVHAMALSQALQQSREGLIAAREDERRRLRRDLHDGLGPALTGVTLKADAARNLLAERPERVDALLAQMQTDIREAITDVRRIIHELRPPALDDLGLMGALRQHIDQLGDSHRSGFDVRLEGPPVLPALPSALEVAAYRVAMEALTNAVRHAGARHAVVRLAVDADLQVEIVDDGPVRDGVWQPGVGLTAMGERVAELGGVLLAWRVPARTAVGCSHGFRWSEHDTPHPRRRRR
jgi:two-component system, NarL family, sensor kinase